jgi:transposase
MIASDETSARVKGKSWWQWTFGCATAVYHVIAPTRSKCVPTDFLGGVKPKMWLLDRLAAQLGRAEEHQFCLADLTRDAPYGIDHGDAIFAPGFKALLQDAGAVGRRRPDPRRRHHCRASPPSRKRTEAVACTQADRCRGPQAARHGLCHCTDKLFVFLKRRDVEPTNNESERALRLSVIFRKQPQGDPSMKG